MCAKVQAAPKQEDPQAYEAPEELLGISGPKPSHVAAGGLRSRVVRRHEESPKKSTAPDVAMLRRWQAELDQTEALLCVDGNTESQCDNTLAPKNTGKNALLDGESKTLLTVESKVQPVARETMEKRSAPSRRNRNHRWFRRHRSLSLARRRPVKVRPPASPQLQQLPSQVAEAYGHDFFQSGWDWPLSRLEKKMRLLELDRELMQAEREELAGKLQEARRSSWS